MIFNKQRKPLSDKTTQYNLFNKNISINCSKDLKGNQAKDVNISDSKDKQTFTNKQNQSQSCHKKIKLTLKNQKSASKAQQSVKNLQKYEQKVSFKRQQINKISQRTKNAYFQPQIIHFSLNSLKQQPQKKPQNNYLQPKSINSSGQKQRAKSKNYSLLKFLTQYSNILCQNNDIQLESQTPIKLYQLSKKLINYSTLLKLLHSFHMIKYPSQAQYKIQKQQQKQQLQKVYLLWKILQINKNQQDCVSNVVQLLVILTSVMNIEYESVQSLIQDFLVKINQRFDGKNNKHKSNQLRFFNKNSIRQSQQPMHIFFIRNKKLLTPFSKIQIYGCSIFNISIDIKNIIVKLNRLKLNRFFKNPTENLEIYQDDSKQTSIHSLISPKSQQLALTKRLKILQELKFQDQNCINQIRQFNANSPVNFFLNYKGSRKCSLQKKTSQNKQKQQKKQKATCKKVSFQKNLKQKKVQRQQYIPSQKVKFSQMKSILNMQKGRKLKLQKQIILQKGWTNNKNIVQQQLKQKLAKSKSFNSLRIQTLHYRQTQKQNNEQNKKQKKKLNSFFTKNDKITLTKLLKQQNTFKNFKNNQQQQQSNKNNQKKSPKNSNHTISINDDQQPIINFENMYSHQTQQNQFILNDSFDENYNSFSSYKQQQSQNCHTEQRKSGSSLKQKKLKTEIYYRPQQEYLSYQQSQNCKAFKTEQIQKQQTSQQKPKTPFQSLRTQQNLNKNIKAPNPQQKNRVIKSYLKIPILYVDVNMDQSKKQRIVIYEDDKPQTLARQFGKKHNLDDRMIERLVQMLSEQINGILGRIDEEEEEYDDTKEDVFEGKEAEFQLEAEYDNSYKQVQQLQQTQQQ